MWIITSILILSLLIFFHELGHFIVARLFGVRVEVFSIGFGKKIASKTIGNTEYAISAIPLGGYVKMKGQDDLNPNEYSSDDDSYNTKSPWKRVCILLAGSTFNILLAFIIYIIIGFYGFSSLSNKIGETLESSPAFKSGLKSGDEIIKIDNNNIKTWRDISEYVSNHTNPMKITYKRNEQLFDVIIIPEIKNAKNLFNEDIKIGYIGISSSKEIKNIKYTPKEIIRFAYNETIYGSKMILLGLQKLILRILPISELGGPISIVQIISKAQENGIIALLGFSALISINLGILNLLPIPALDGGHIIFTIYEWITRKPLNENIMYKLTIFGWIILLGLMIIGVYNDISRIITKTGI